MAISQEQSDWKLTEQHRTKLIAALRRRADREPEYSVRYKILLDLLSNTDKQISSKYGLKSRDL